jgi:phospholipid-binding lipoprotein MlaA
LSPFAAVNSRGSVAVPTLAILALLLGGCGTLSGAVRGDSVLGGGVLASPPGRDTVATAGPSCGVAEVAESVVADGIRATCELAAEELETPVAGSRLLIGWPENVTAEGDAGAASVVAQARGARGATAGPANAEEFEEEYDPWEPFNEKMFEFNRRLDRYLLKPAAQVYSKIIPEPFQVLIATGFDNIAFVPRAVNSLLQGKWSGAGREVARFLINSTLGIGGLFDAAKYWQIEKSREDFGQTLCVWGVGQGPYLILPGLAPLTTREGIGKAVDGVMDPLSYFFPFLWTGVGMQGGDLLNERALNLELFQGFEESVIDMYSAVRNGYLRRREQLCKE